MANDSLANMAGKGTTVVIKGKEYHISQLTIDDLADIEAHLKAERLKVYRSVSNGEDPQLKALTTAQILSSPVDALGSATTIAGIKFILYRALRKENPQIEYEKMGQLIDLSNLDEMATTVKLITEMGKESLPLAETAEASL